MNDDLERMLERHEGCRPLPYIDSVGVETIGIGHNLRKPLSRVAIMQIFRDDITETINDCTHAFPWFSDLTEPRQHAVIDMCFNLGLTKLLGFQRFIKAMELGQYDTAANEMLDSLWAKQVKGRAIELASMIRGSQDV